MDISKIDLTTFSKRSLRAISQLPEPHRTRFIVRIHFAMKLAKRAWDEYYRISGAPQLPQVGRPSSLERWPETNKALRAAFKKNWGKKNFSINYLISSEEERIRIFRPIEDVSRGIAKKFFDDAKEDNFIIETKDRIKGSKAHHFIINPEEF